MQTRRRPYHHGDLRAALLARAEETLQGKGPAALSLRELARDLGVSHAAPSRHFKDKQALLDALALTGFERLTEILAASQEGAAESFARRMHSALHAYVDFATANAELLDLMYSIKHDPQASQELSEAIHRWSQEIFGLIAEGQRLGEVREGPLERVATPVLTTLHGYADMAVSGLLPPETAEHGLNDLVAYILRGCAPD
ncbi:TetR/AcrR family transcriptional regulator [Streptomyces turgidiscabies]|uniref:Transcriptional regulator, TetR family n=1 Tax=Streptomyces turgidiscabies (strain Car8) TaxID=698760 RepID=L7EWM4_STRT8|nr:MULTISPECIES: TetR/AcrR family transcriptional regulator [Streptomyces]ELP63081.1 transcriptional regulator, TetR family [Streptomyces turgidiscabies Car8]MDX3494917.1 TetR/AcrR family transcriptional regulator [Streptomyces turgidiscabies]GAQ71532.1 bacterial regulatory proteins, tetR family [Streptomyces turgidiscabies]